MVDVDNFEYDNVGGSADNSESGKSPLKSFVTALSVCNARVWSDPPDWNAKRDVTSLGLAVRKRLPPHSRNPFRVGFCIR